MPKKETKVTKPKKEPKYKITIEVNAESFDFKGDDVLEILNTFEKPALLKTDFVVKATAGKKTVEDVVRVQEARRLFANTVSMELFVLNLVKRLG